MKKAIATILLLLLAGCQRMNTTLPVTPAATVAVTAAAEPAAPEAIDYAFPFTAQTLAGETVTEEVFGQHDLTLVKVWASWCPSCRKELPELAALYDRLPENVGFLSVTIDAPGDLKDAKAILEQNGCSFPCLDGQGSEGLVKGLLSRVMYIPTTVFFDSRGNEVDEWIVGLPRGGDLVGTYLSEIQARLDLLAGK